MKQKDDHDYNQNDGNRHNPTKEMIREAYLDFLDVAYDSPRRTNPNGIYHSFYVGDNVCKKNLLYLRYT